VLPSVPEGAAGGLLTGAAAAFGAVELFELFFFGLAALSAFFSLILWSCLSHPWPHRSVASFAHERFRYGQRAARQRTKRCIDSSRFSFWVYPSIRGG
jgi:predicted lipid-binding transport protein (Tim44 family)